MNLLAAIPSHPLFVHVPVVLVPLAAIGAIAIAVRPRWMAAYGYPVAGLAGVGFVGALIAAHTGEELEESYQAAGQTIARLLHDHGELGETAESLALVFFVLAAAWVASAWWIRRGSAVTNGRAVGWVGLALRILAPLAGIATTAVMIAAGHNGARAVWDQAIR
mgnify:CR=1 FL=1